jgi:Glycosyl hydrolase family 26
MLEVKGSLAQPPTGGMEGSVPATTSAFSHRRQKPMTRVIIAAMSTVALLIAGAASTQAATTAPSTPHRVTSAHQVLSLQRTTSRPKVYSPPQIAASTSVHPPQPVPGWVIYGAFTLLPGQTAQASVTTRESQLGRKYAVNSHYYDWADPFPGSPEAADAAAGRTPMDTWWGIDPRKIVNGSQDALIRTRAKAVAAFGKPMFLRWGAEMNGNWYAWSGTAVGNDPSVFVAAWRHIHDIFATEGVHNAAWVWAPNADSHPGGISTTSWNNWRNYYPGDTYVDWVGIDGYNWGATDSWQSFGQVFGPVYADYVGRKPIMIAETGSIEAGGNKAAWLADAATWIKAHRSIMAFVYFDTNQSSSGLDWRADSSSTSLSAYITMARDPYFSGRPG